MNVTGLVNTLGTVVEHVEYDAYGKPTFMNGSWGSPSSTSGYANEVLYTGQRYDPETGLYLYRNRHYHPTLGRFLQRDPIGYGDGMNLYEYVGGRPHSRVDPEGLEDKKGSDLLLKGAKVVTDTLEGYSKNGVRVSGQSVSMPGTKGKKNAKLPPCKVQRKNFRLHKLRVFESIIIAKWKVTNVKVGLYFKWDGCDVRYLGVTVDESSFIKNGTVTVKGESLGPEDGVKGNCRCCDEAACVEYKVTIDYDFDRSTLGIDDLWLSFMYVACGDGSIREKDRRTSNNNGGLEKQTTYGKIDVKRQKPVQPRHDSR